LVILQVLARDRGNGPAPAAEAIGRVDARLGPIAGLVGGEAAVRHALVGVRQAQVAVPGGVELAVAAVEKVELGVAQCWVVVALSVTVLVA